MTVQNGGSFFFIFIFFNGEATNFSISPRIREICIFVKSKPLLFQTRGEVMQRRARVDVMNRLYKPRCFKAIYSKNVFNMCINIYNALPEDIRVLQGNMFRNKLSNWLLDKCYYSVKNFLEPNVNL